MQSMHLGAEFLMFNDALSGYSNYKALRPSVYRVKTHLIYRYAQTGGQIIG